MRKKPECMQAQCWGVYQPVSQPKPVPHRSIVVWPEDVSCGNANNESVDTHPSKEAADAVCRGVMRNGLGGEGKIFPLSTRSEPII